MKPLDLIQYVQKYVKVKTHEGREYEGYVITYENAIEYDDQYDKIGIEYPDFIVLLEEDEIASIEIVD